MKGFVSKEQLDLLEPYFDQFFDTLVLQSKTSSYKSLCSFFFAMLPRLSVKDAYIFRLYKLLYDTPDSQGPFQSTLKDGIDILFRTQRILQLAQQDCHQTQLSWQSRSHEFKI